MKEKNLFTKLAIVTVLCGLAIFQLYPPSKTLKGGIDLVGGHSLLFEIDTSGMDQSQKASLPERVMKVLKNRVDPNNQRNLVWLPIGNNRLEIQMPRPTAEASKRREAYDLARENMMAMNVSRGDVEVALSVPEDQRKAKLMELTHGVAGRESILQQIHEAHGAMLAARAAGDEIEADRNLEKYETAIDDLLGTNLNFGRLQDVLALESRETREKGINDLIAAHPAYKDPILQISEKYNEWTKEKTTLEDPSDLIRMLKGAGVLEFRILADRDLSNRTHLQSADPILREPISTYVEKLHKRGPRPEAGDHYLWVRIRDPQRFLDREDTGFLENFEAGKGSLPWVVEKYADNYYVLMHADDKYGLLHKGGKEWSLVSAIPSRDFDTGKPCVNFTLDARGGSLFRDLTRGNLKRQLAIVLDDQAVSHATIQSEIREQGRIFGDFTPDDVMYLVNTLEAGALPARLKETPLQVRSIGSTLGDTNRKKGLSAAIWAAVAVSAFMIIYYLFAGLVANVALALNLVFTLALMSLLEATWTLPGVAGLVLTVGMAVDANVLIFERIREELARGMSLRAAVKAGYEKAFSSIFDANLTTLITCVILGFVGSEEIKGFGLVLGLGVATSMGTALYLTRWVFALLIKYNLLHNLPMLQFFKKPNIDWIGMRRVFWPASLTYLALSVIGFVYFNVTNKAALYDIEFLGGTNVQIKFKPGDAITDEQLREAVVGKGPIGKDASSAANWLNAAADDLAAARIETPAPGEVRIAGDKLTGNQLSAMMLPFVETEMIKGTDARTAHAFGFKTKSDSKLDSAALQERVKDAADYVRQAATRVATSRIQTTESMEQSEQGGGPSFDIVTTETNKDIVQESILAVLGPRLVVDQAVTFKPGTDASGKGAGYFPIEENDVYLSDVIGGDYVQDIRRYKGGAALVLDDVTPPQTVAEVTDRLKRMRLQPDFEQYEWRPFEVIGLNPAGDGTYSSIAVTVSDENYLYFDNPDAWEQNVAKPELAQLTAALGTEKSLQKVVQFAPQVAREAQHRAILAIILALVAIVAYIWFRFGSATFGLAAIIALVHDITITLGLIAFASFAYQWKVFAALGIADFKIDLTMIGALLTIMGYSINDTIVTYDRVRENRGKLTALSAKLLNDSINQVLSRSVLTSFTVFLAVFIMYIFGGPGIRGFSFAMMAGALFGTFSSIAIAVPLVYHPAVLRKLSYVLGGLILVGLASILESRTFTLVVAGIALALVAFGFYKESQKAPAGRQAMPA